MMEVDKINSPKDLEIYIEGCINDFEGGISDKDETIVNILECCAQFAGLYHKKINEREQLKQDGTNN